MDNRRRFNFGSLMTAIVIIGVLISFISDLPLGQMLGSTGSGGLGGSGLEGFLDNLNMILMFAAIAVLIIFLFVQAGRKDAGKRDRDRDE